MNCLGEDPPFLPTRNPTSTHSQFGENNIEDDDMHGLVHPALGVRSQ